MVIDTSTIVAIFFDAPDAPNYRERIANDPNGSFRRQRLSKHR